MILNLTFIFFLDCPLYSIERRTLLRSLVNIDHKLLDNTDVSLTQTLLFGNTVFNAKENTKIFNLTIEFVLSTKKFDGPLLWILFFFFLIPLIKIHQTTKQSYLRQVAIGYYNIEFCFRCCGSPGSTSINFVDDSFILLKTSLEAWFL